jgi:predicted RNase H-like nuclease (RuvC/YqgF family)
LKTLNKKIVFFQDQLKTANDTIFQQNKKLEQKNQQLTDLLGQLEEKHKLVDNLQNEIKELESQKSSEISEKEKKIEQLEEELKEKDEIIAMLKDKPPLVVNDKNTKNVSFSSESDLLKLIEYHRKEIQKLKKIIETQSQSTIFSEVKSENTLKETVQDLPKKNSSTLYLSLLGGSLMTISLGLKK